MVDVLTDRCLCCVCWCVHNSCHRVRPALFSSPIGRPFSTTKPASELPLSGLTAVSPIDGRYGRVTAPLRSVFSEFGLIKQRGTLLVAVGSFLMCCGLWAWAVGFGPWAWAVGHGPWAVGVGVLYLALGCIGVFFLLVCRAVVVELKWLLLLVRLNAIPELPSALSPAALSYVDTIISQFSLSDAQVRHGFVSVWLYACADATVSTVE
jgi:hypothetical protein